MRSLTLFFLLCLFALPSYAQQLPKTDTLSFWVNGTCGSCKARIEDALMDLAGVRQAAWDVQTKVCTVIYSPKRMTPERLKQVVLGLGYSLKDIPTTVPRTCCGGKHTEVPLKQ